MFLSFYEIFSQVITLGGGVVKNEVMRFIGENDYGRAKRLFGEYHFIRLILSVMLWAILFFGSPLLAFRYQPDFIFMIRVASLLLLLEFLSTFIQALLNMQFRFGAAVRVLAYSKVIQFFILLYFYFFAYIGVKEILFSLIISLAAAIIFIMPAAIHEWRPWRARNASGEKLLFRLMRGHGKWDISRAFVSHITSRVQPFVIKMFLNTEAVGIYGVAKSLVELLVSFLSVGTLSSLVPRVIGDRGKMRTIFVFGSKYLVIASIIFVIAGSAGAFILFNLFFEDYLTALPYFYLLVLLLPALAIGQIIDVFLVTWRRQKFTFLRSITRSVAWIGLLVLLLPVFGLWGGVAAEVLAAGISVIWSYYYLIKLEPAFRPKFFELASFGPDDKMIRSIFFRNFLNMLRFMKP